ncbi:hypothetical protein E3T26_08660 [Cryobacterium sp. TMT1-21]|uniref:hypothetical protein n=1 Tax=Cryobacterium sp. TMT1-21 TaxID=1259234 RepID=UPI00106979D5|nr:hypothetical protein [Cryobacterium sp. TMT1-21]TFD14185.1 hypothetical protein E3T26_08660 [Cryobacterium sp. TMT1-21]
MPVIAGIFLIIGGGLGGIISYLSAKAADIRKANRDDTQLWNERLLLRASEFLASRETALHELRALQRIPTIPGSADAYNAQHHIYGLAIRAMVLKGQALALIAPTNVRTASKGFLPDLAQLENDKTANDVQLLNTFNQKNLDFIDMVREVVGVPEYTGATT